MFGHVLTRFDDLMAENQLAKRRKTSRHGRISKMEKEDTGTKSNPPLTSYQFAPSSIEGWNDCPVLPHNLSSSSLQSDTKKASSRRNRRPVHVSHIGYNDNSSQSSITSSPAPPLSRLPPNRSSSSLSLKTPPPPPPSLSSTSSTRKRVEEQLEELVKHASTLPAEEHKSCSEKISSRSILDQDANVVFLDRLFSAWKSGNRNIDDTAVVNILYDFTHADNGNISWLLSLKKMMTSVKQ